MSPHLRPACFFLLFGLLSTPSPLVAELPNDLQQNAPNTPNTNTDAHRELRHEDPQWETVKAHLPDPATATEEQLETVGDVLRARRFPEDALDYYLHALRRGGNDVMLMNKIGAVEYMDGRFATAISDYSRAIKLNKTSAIYHSNLATALFEEKRYKDARAQYKIALQLDPDMAHHDGTGGLTAHMLSPEDHARYCFEMARLYAELGDETNMLRYLTMASEGGFDVLGEMRSDAKLDRYRKDTRVILLVQNAKALRSGRASVDDASSKIPPLPPVQPN